MMEMHNEEQLIDLWDMFSAHIDPKNKEQIAVQYVNWCIDNGVPEEVVQTLGNADPYLEEAVAEALGPIESYDDDDDLNDEEEW